MLAHRAISLRNLALWGHSEHRAGRRAKLRFMSTRRYRMMIWRPGQATKRGAPVANGAASLWKSTLRPSLIFSMKARADASQVW